MVYVDEDFSHTPRLLVGCGNSIKTINTANHDGIHEFIMVSEAVQERQHIEEVVCSCGSIWCFLSLSSKIYRFDKTSGAHLGTLCVRSSLEIGGSLFSRNNTLLHVQIDVPDESSQAEFTVDETILVTSLIAVNDSLWIGRNTGDILVVSADRQNELGKLNAVLETDQLLGIPVGPVTSMFHPISGKVVAIREITKKSDPKYDGDYDYQILVWQDWGNVESVDFQNDLRIYH